MKTKVYLLDNTMATTDALEEIKNRIPCWVDTKPARVGEDMMLEVEIKCREADVAFVERMLADVV